MKRNFVNVPIFDNKKIEYLSLKFGISSLLAKMLVNRNITDDNEIAEFLGRTEKKLPSPFLIKDMDKAASRIKKAIADKEKISIYGDYDVDGVTSVALLYKYFKTKDIICDYYVPDRITEGYGMNKTALDGMKKKNIDLIITVDTGVTAVAEIEYAKQLGIDVIITDHHECKLDIPDCCAVVNPKRHDSEYPFCDIAGVSVAFKLICAIEDDRKTEQLLSDYADLVAIGTVSDVMPIVSENRMIVKRGLSKISSGNVCYGISELLVRSFGKITKDITASSIGFSIAPRINAAGRISHAKEAVSLLLSENRDDAAAIADKLCEFNSRRQVLESEIMEQVLEYIDKNDEYKKNKIIIASGAGWHQGVIGIVASRIAERYRVPTILFAIENGVYKGSARSIKGFNLFEAISNCEKYLLKFGGHELAAGLTLSEENYDIFCKEISKLTKDKISEDMMNDVVNVECILSPDDYNMKTAKELSVLEPFGNGNPYPVFLGEDIKILSSTALSRNKHSKYYLNFDNGIKTVGLYFGHSIFNSEFTDGDKTDMIFSLGINKYAGKETLQISIKCGASKDNNVNNSFLILDDISLLDKRLIDSVPQRNDFIRVYNFIKHNAANGASEYNVNTIGRFIEGISDLSIAIIFAVFKELSLFDISKNGDLMKIKINNATKKIDLASSRILKYLKEEGALV